MTQTLPAPVLSYNSGAAGADEHAWVQGNHLLVRDRIVLPARCIKCNAADTLKLKTQNLSWNPPLMYFLLFLGLLLGGLILLLTQRKASIGVHACAACRRHILKHTLIAVGIFLLADTAFITAAGLHSGTLALLGCALLFAFLVYVAIKPRLFTTARITDGIAFLKGVSPDYLRTLGQP